MINVKPGIGCGDTRQTEFLLPKQNKPAFWQRKKD